MAEATEEASATDAADPVDAPNEYDVVVVGGGPAGCSAGVFTARAGLDTAIFDRGNSSIRRCAHLENYLGFPDGIDVDTYYALIHDHAEEAGCDLIADMVESVAREGEGFRVETADGPSVVARRVIAATKYDGEYLRGLDDVRRSEAPSSQQEASGASRDEDAMFETHEHDGEVHRQFNADYADRDGRTPVAGLYVAGPLGGARDQAVIAAGHGASVAAELIEDVRRDAGYWDRIADYYDWLRREEELSGEWADRDHWRAYVDEQMTPDELDLDDGERERLRDRYVEDRFDQYLSRDERERRAERGHRRLAEHVDDETNGD